jgi:tRNA1(Val) A37 N6-methylase TrmN6
MGRGSKLEMRLRDILDMEEDENEKLEHLVERMWPLIGRYSYQSREAGMSQIMYIMDEVGSRFCEVLPRRSLGISAADDKNPTEGKSENESNSAAFRCALIFHPDTREAFTAFWPRRDVTEGEIATCDNLPHGQAARLARLQVLSNASVDDTMEGEESEEKEAGGKISRKSIEASHRLRQFLESAGYCNVRQVNSLLGLEETYGRLLPVWEISDPRLRNAFVTQLAAAESRLKSSATSATEGTELCPTGDFSILTFLIRFFLMGLPASRADLLRHIPDQTLLQQLDNIGLLLVEGPDGPFNDASSRDKTRVKSLVQIVPVPVGDTVYENDCALLLTDFAQIGGLGEGFEPVMYVGPDSLGLVAATLGSQEKNGAMAPRRILDVCAGCGVQGIAAMLRARMYGPPWEMGQQQQSGSKEAFPHELILLELNPRAARFAHFNAALNHLEAVTSVVVGDVNTVRIADLPCPVFDIVLSNPPYIPNPQQSVPKLHQYGDGGTTGEEVTQGVVSLAAQALSRNRTGGRLYTVGNLTNVDTLPDRVERWWCDGLQCSTRNEEQQGLQIKAYHGLKWSAAEYAALVHNHALGDTGALAHDLSAKKYKEALEATGVRNVANGFVFVRCPPFKGDKARRMNSSGMESDAAATSSITSQAYTKNVIALQDQVWQVLAMGKDPEATETRRRLTEHWL